MNPVAPFQTGSHVWTAASMADAERWTWTLSPCQVDQLLTSTEHLSEVPLDQLATSDVANVSLFELIDDLDNLYTSLISGPGFMLISGVPVNSISTAHAAAAFLAVSAHVGAARPQNAAGDLLGHVKDIGVSAADPDVRIYQTAERQTFHTDSADVVGLLCLENAESGGDSMLVSAAAIYNEMLRSDPEIAHRLFEPVATDRRGEVAEGQDPFFTIPVLSWHRTFLSVIYQRQYIESAQRFPAASRLTSEASEALDIFDEIANRPDMHLSMSLVPGDMQFVHNHSLLHDRTGFVSRPDSPRHLLRVWLSVPGDRPLPDVFADRYGTTEIGNRGGAF